MGERRTAADAEAAFYDAFERADLAAMTDLWAEDPSIVCIHPLGAVLTGPEEVNESWRQLFAQGPSLKFAPRPISQLETPEAATHIIYEFVSLPGEHGERPPLITTNSYRRINGNWHIVLHHASPHPDSFAPLDGAPKSEALH